MFGIKLLFVSGAQHCHHPWVRSSRVVFARLHPRHGKALGSWWTLRRSL